MSNRTGRVPGVIKDRLFRIGIGTTLAVLGIYFGGLLISLAGSTTATRFWELLGSKEIVFAIRLSVVTATLATLAAIILALPAAYALSHFDFRGKDLVDTLLDLPIVLSPIALGAALMVFSNTRLGRFIEGNFLSFVFEVPGVVLAQFTVVVALATRLLKSTFDMIDPRYVSVGKVLGCTGFQAFHRITLRLARPGITAAVLLTWARAVGEYGASVTLAGATTMKTETLPIAIYLSFATADVEKAIAVIFVLVGIAAVALVTLRWVGGRSVTQ
jgi:molybdate transport system permease protein